MSLQLRRGTNADRLTVTFDEGEIVFTTDTKKVFVGDGITVGGLFVGYAPERVSTIASNALPAINVDEVDTFIITAQAVDISSFTTNLTGTPLPAQKLWITITGTALRNITWGASFEDGAQTLPLTVGTTRLDIAFTYNAATSKFRCMAKG